MAAKPRHQYLQVEGSTETKGFADCWCVVCRFEDDQVFTQAQETQINSVQLQDGDWYIRLRGDYAGRVVGSIYNNANITDPQPIPLTVSVPHACSLPGYSQRTTWYIVPAWRSWRCLFPKPCSACCRGWVVQQLSAVIL